MLSEHSSERLRFLIRKGGKNADLIGKESLWIYTVMGYLPESLEEDIYLGLTIRQDLKWKCHVNNEGEQNAQLSTLKP
jgi:hypothetical protein